MPPRDLLADFRVAGKYASNSAMESRWRELADLHGGSRETLGTSREGRPIVGWRFPAEGGTAPRVLLVSLIHPMEWIGRSTHLGLLESLLQAPVEMPRPELLSIPNANPDGVERVESALRAGRFRWVRGNSAGVDLNRNFPEGHRRRPRWLDWVPMWNPGPAPLSEPETAAICGWVASMRPAVAVSFHSFGRWFFYPPAATRRVTPLAESHASCLRAIDAPGYRSAQLGRWAFWFRAFGTEIDCFAAHGALSFLVEVSSGGFGTWPARQIFHPFSIFNPLDPEPEIVRVLPSLHRLIGAALREAPRRQASRKPA